MREHLRFVGYLSLAALASSAVACSTSVAGVASDRPAHAGRAWQTVSSPNFVLYTDGDVEKAKERLKVLENFRLLCGEFTTAVLRSDLPPLRIIAPTRFEAFETLDPGDKVAGYFRRNYAGSFAVFELDNAEYLVALRTALHEYVHFLQFRASTRPMPLWYREGFAEYLSAVDVKQSGTLIAGATRPGSLLQVIDRKWWSLEELLTHPEDLGHDRLYSQSWLLVHYMTNEHPAALQRYLREHSAQPSVPGFERAIGMPLAQVEGELKKYARRRIWRGARFEPPERAIAFQVRAFDNEERDYLLLQMGVQRLRPERMNELFKATPKHSLARLAQVEHLAYVDDRPQAALTVIDPLLRKHPNDARLLAMKSRLLVSEKSFSEPEDFKLRYEEAMALVRKAYELDPMNVEALEMIARLALREPERFDRDNIRTAIDNAMVLAPQRLELWLLKASFHANYREFSEARRISTRLLRITKDPRLRKAARAFLARLNARPQ